MPIEFNDFLMKDIHFFLSFLHLYDCFGYRNLGYGKGRPCLTIYDKSRKRLTERLRTEEIKPQEQKKLPTATSQTTKI